MSPLPAITIVGLGPGDPQRLTIAARDALDRAHRIFVRVHPGLDLGSLLERENVTDIAGLRQADDGPGGRWRVATLAVCDAALQGPVVLAIPVHPRFGEGLVVGTLREAEARGLSTGVVDGLSVIDLVATALGVDPLLEGVQCFTARQLLEESPDGPFAGGSFTASPRRPMLFTHVYDKPIIARVARSLRRILPLTHPVIRIDAAGLPGQQISTHTVADLAHIAAGPLVALWVPAMDPLLAGRDPRTLQYIGARLRRPDGCPWDREQSHASLAPSFVDEVYEVVDAIVAGHHANLAEELGDIFLHIVMQAQIAEEMGEFALEDVFEGIATKIVRRHPHVFGDDEVRSSVDVVGLWQKVKQAEKASQPHDKPEKDFDGQPRSKPSIVRATKILAETPLPGVETDRGVDERAADLLRAVAAVVQAGDDPDVVLMESLRAHHARHAVATSENQD